MSEDEGNDTEADSETGYEALQKANIASTPDEDPRGNEDGNPDSE